MSMRRPNQAMELTAARTAFTFSMIELHSFRAPLAPTSGSLSCSRSIPYPGAGQQHRYANIIQEEVSCFRST
jgi:hypothetical protein